MTRHVYGLCFVRRATVVRGNVLIEVLVSIVLLAFALLGFVALQSALLQAQSGSRARSVAGYLGTEIVGLMWADLPNLARYDTGSGCASGSTCASWRGKVASALPAGSATIAISEATGEAAVLIRWQEGRSEWHQYETRTRLRL